MLIVLSLFDNFDFDLFLLHSSCITNLVLSFSKSGDFTVSVNIFCIPFTFSYSSDTISSSQATCFPPSKLLYRFPILFSEFPASSAIASFKIFDKTVLDTWVFNSVTSIVDIAVAFSMAAQIPQE